MRIDNITINGKNIALKNMVLIVGSNGVGKTRLLEELFTNFAGANPRTNHWSINFQENISDQDFTLWFSELLKAESVPGNTTSAFWYCPFSKISSHTNSSPRHLSNAEYKQYKDGGIPIDKRFLQRELIHYLSVEHRLADNFSMDLPKPSTPAQAIVDILERKQEIFYKIKEIFERFFDKKIYLSTHDSPGAEIIITNSDSTEIPEITHNRQKDFNNIFLWKEQHKIQPIKLQGHGIRSFLNILVTYCFPTNNILMIDEPELHLYPSSKRKFGQLLGNLSNEPNKQFFCVTHDSDFMQGILNSAKEITIIKLFGKQKNYMLVDTQYDKKNYLMSTQKSDHLIQIPFLDCAIIVEASSDQVAYEYVFSHKNFLGHFEYKFIPAYGKNNILNAKHIINQFKVPFSIILDFDSILHKKDCSEIAIKPLIDDEDFKEVCDISKELKTIQNISESGINSISDEKLKHTVIALLEKLQHKYNIFIVPVGCLESWKKIECDKRHYPEELILTYNKDPTPFLDLEKFLEKIEQCLKKQL